MTVEYIVASFAMGTVFTTASVMEQELSSNVRLRGRGRPPPSRVLA